MPLDPGSLFRHHNHTRNQARAYFLYSPWPIPGGSLFTHFLRYPEVRRCFLFAHVSVAKRAPRNTTGWEGSPLTMAPWSIEPEDRIFHLPPEPKSFHSSSNGRRGNESNGRDGNCFCFLFLMFCEAGYTGTGKRGAHLSRDIRREENAGNLLDLGGRKGFTARVSVPFLFLFVWTRRNLGLRRGVAPFSTSSRLRIFIGESSFLYLFFSFLFGERE